MSYYAAARLLGTASALSRANAIQETPLKSNALVCGKGLVETAEAGRPNSASGKPFGHKLSPVRFLNNFNRLVKKRVCLRCTLCYKRIKGAQPTIP